MIPENKYLGAICKHGHEYKNTGKGLRYHTSSNCTICAQKWQKTSINNKKRLPIINYKEYRIKKRLMTNLTLTKDREELGDNYIKKLLVSKSKLAVADLPKELIEIKRAAIIIDRYIRSKGGD
jgi:hypothetical protein